MPTEAKAGFFAWLGGQVSADANILQTQSTDNSQTLPLLEANVPPQEKNDSGKKEDKIDENVSINISDNALVASRPMGTAGADSLESSEDEVSVYVVRPGDTTSTIANMFGVSTDTILTANDIKKGSALVPGDVLFILPISGLKHTVTQGETVASIAKKYTADVADILAYNSLAAGASLAVGDELMIPDGEMADEGGDKPAPNLGAIAEKDKNYYATHPVKSAVGYFIDPVPTGRKTQGLHDHNQAIDIGAPSGSPIYAAAAGTVLGAKSAGYNGGYGNMVIIKHPNGAQTLYAHMSKVSTKTGASVKQGQLIGYVGSTGHSTGPHLHFRVMGAKNPGTDWSWKK